MVPGERSSPTYAKPRILLVDMPEECECALIDAGYNVAAGTFGSTCSVQPSEGLHPVPMNTSELPDFEEQEIIVVNTSRPLPTGQCEVTNPGEGVSALWQRSNEGIIDPRPYVMTEVRHAFDRVLSAGGIAIVLLDARYQVRYTIGSAARYRSFITEARIDRSSWSFFSELDALHSHATAGCEIEIFPESQEFGTLLRRGMNDARYCCTVHPEQPHNHHWIPLAKNKFGGCVAGALIRDDRPACLIVVPQMPELHKILPDMIGNWCVKWRPKLFPFHEGRNWVHNERYEIPKVVDLCREIERTRAEAEEHANHLKAQIQMIRAENQDWYSLLNGTGDGLVGALIRSLGKLGFTKVLNVDEQARSEGQDRSLREDIQIRDNSPILIVDVKGLIGRPEDADATQSQKHALMRAKEFKGDVKALTIINHQRNLPPHDRDANAYRKEIVGNAEQTNLGLMTAWDVFRLLRNKELLGWHDDVVKPVFYRSGRIEPIPEHYVEIGRIAHAWKSAFGILPNRPIRAGSRLSVEVGDSFEEIFAASLQVDDKPVAEAPAESNCGVACEDAAKRFRKGMRVFLIRTRE
jgi:hypothetical protein